MLVAKKTSNVKIVSVRSFTASPEERAKWAPLIRKCAQPPPQSKAEQSLKKYLAPWAREVRQRTASLKDKPVTIPQFILGKSGQIAMNIWRTIATNEGAKGLNRTQTELFVFSSWARNTRSWKELVHTPSAFVPIETKIDQMRNQLNQLGCSEIFVKLMIPILADGSISKLDQITTDFNEINRSFRREVDVKLVTGKKLDTSTIDFYKATISLDFLDPADNMIFSYTVDPSITGYKVYIKNKLHDFTHTEDIKNTQQKEASALKYTPRDLLFRDLEGVMSKNDIESIWNNQNNS